MAKKSVKRSKKARSASKASAVTRTVAKARQAKPSSPAQSSPVKASETRTQPPKKLPNVWQLTTTAAQLLWQHRKLFAGIILIYGAFNLVLVQAFTSSIDAAGLKSQLVQFGTLGSSLVVFANLISTTGRGSSDSSAGYYLALLILVSLAVVWALRQVTAGVNIKVRDAYYRGMYPLVPVLLVLGMIALELLPLLIGGTIYNLVLTNGIAVNTFEKLSFATLFAASALLTLYWLSSSLFALYIVSLPAMTPMKALRSARKLVKGRRWIVVRKLLFLPLLLLVAGTILLVPTIMVLAPVAPWVFFIFSVLALPSVHAYLYTLYKELLDA